MKITWKTILYSIVLVKIAFHLYINGLYSLHRDALLYLTLGEHLDWGFASVPPSIAAFGWFGRHILGGSVEAIRLVPTLFGTATLILTMLMCREMGGKKWAVFAVGLACLFSPSFLRTSMMFQPVVFDVFYWTLFSFLFLKYINTNAQKYLWLVGLSFGLGFLNKYSVAFYALGMLPALLFSPQRVLFFEKNFWYAISLALLVASPNLLWQFHQGFPVVEHFNALSETQFANVSKPLFLLDQVLQNLPATLLWIAGLLFLFFDNSARKYRLLGVFALSVVVFFLLLNAKSYYTLGVYPPLIAAGGVAFEKWAISKYFTWIRYAIPLSIVVLGLCIMPVSVPVFPPEQCVTYYDKVAETIGNNNFRRWEDGNYYPLPQDFADMLGWEELSDIVKKIWASVPDKSTTYIYTENYGQAGSIELFGKDQSYPQVWSFSDSYRYWLPDSIPHDLKTLIYVNSELGDNMPTFFGHIEQIGNIKNHLAREQGTGFWVCTEPTPLFFETLNGWIVEYGGNRN